MVSTKSDHPCQSFEEIMVKVENCISLESPVMRVTVY